MEFATNLVKPGDGRSGWNRNGLRLQLRVVANRLLSAEVVDSAARTKETKPRLIRSIESVLLQSA